MIEELKIKMTIDEALAFADEWSCGMTVHPDSQGWRVACMMLAGEVRKLRQANEVALTLGATYAIRADENGGKTGSPPGMLQDDSRALSRALASKPDAMLHAREAAASIAKERAQRETDGLRADALRHARELEVLAANGCPLHTSNLKPVAETLRALAAACTSTLEQTSAQAVRNVQGAAKMVANMLERDGTPVRAEAAEELLKVVGELAGLAEQPSAAVEAAWWTGVVAGQQLQPISNAMKAHSPEPLAHYSIPLFTALPSEPLRVGSLTDAEIDHRFDLFDWEGYTDQSIAVRAFVRQVLATQPTSAAAPATNSFVQPVPDKCDRITWRGHYYQLPLEASAAADVDALAQFIRSIDGWSRMGAGVLAEHICEWIATTPEGKP